MDTEISAETMKALKPDTESERAETFRYAISCSDLQKFA
jgi:hypothetical protein